MAEQIKITTEFIKLADVFAKVFLLTVVVFAFVLVLFAFVVFFFVVFVAFAVFVLTLVAVLKATVLLQELLDDASDLRTLPLHESLGSPLDLRTLLSCASSMSSMLADETLLMLKISTTNKVKNIILFLMLTPHFMSFSSIYFKYNP